MRVDIPESQTCQRLPGWCFREPTIHPVVILVLGMIGIACGISAKAQGYSSSAASIENPSIGIYPMTTVIENPASGYYSDPYPIHLAGWIELYVPQFFSGTTKELLVCPNVIHADCAAVAPLLVKPGPLAQKAKAAGTEITAYNNSNIYQDRAGAWQMAVTFYVKKLDDPKSRQWNVIAHAHPTNPLLPTNWVADSLLVGDFAHIVDANYDGKYFEDDGKLYLIYSKALSISPLLLYGLVAQQMTSAEEVASVEPVVLFGPDKANSGFNSEYFYGLSPNGQPVVNTFKVIETGNITRIKGKYALAYSTGAFFLPGYKAGIAWSDTFLPEFGSTYKRVLQEDYAGVWGQPNHAEVRYLLQSQRADWPNYVAPQVLAPGVPSIVKDETGAFRLYFDGYNPSDPTIQLHPGDPFLADRRRPYFSRLKVDIPEGATVANTTNADLVRWLTPCGTTDRRCVRKLDDPGR